jgi:hypothetical protein
MMLLQGDFEAIDEGFSALQRRLLSGLTSGRKLGGNEGCGVFK